METIQPTPAMSKKTAKEAEISKGDAHGTEALYAATAEAIVRYPARRAFLGDTTITPKAERRAFEQGAKWQAIRETKSLEAENESLRKALQMAVDDLRRLRKEFGERTGTATQIGNMSFFAAAEIGVKPSDG